MAKEENEKIFLNCTILIASREFNAISQEKDAGTYHWIAGLPKEFTGLDTDIEN